MEKTISVSRTKIDKITVDLVKLLRDRNQLCLDIGNAKKSQGMAVYDPDRERKVFDKATKAAKKYGVNEKLVEDILRLIIEESKNAQNQELISGQIDELKRKYKVNMVDLGNGRTIMMISKPKVEDLSKEMASKFSDIAKSGFGKSKDESDMLNHIKGDLLHILLFGDKIVGFASYILYETDGKKILYLNGMVTNSDNQKNGFFYNSLGNAIKEISPDYIAGRTQSMVVYRAMLNFTGLVYPSIIHNPSTDAIKIGDYIAQKLKMSGYLDNEFVERGTYGESLYSNVPKVDDKEIAKLFSETIQMNYAAGDSIIFVCPMANYKERNKMLLNTVRTK